jgi:hypothetical protein
MVDLAWRQKQRAAPVWLNLKLRICDDLHNLA